MFTGDIEDNESGLEPSKAYGISVVNNYIFDKTCLIIHFGFKRMMFIRHSSGKICTCFLDKDYNNYPFNTKIFIGVII